MTYATSFQSAFANTSIWQRLDTLRADLAERLATYQLYRATLNEMSALSDRDLADIGLHRGQIRDVATDTAYRA